MRLHLLAVLLLAGTAMPAAAQERVERRVDRLEQEMDAVQRRVFPGGGAEYFQPEIRPEVSTSIGGVPAGSALSDLTARVDALEAQLARLTGQTEENAFRLRQIEDSLNRFKSDAESRFSAIERPPAPRPEPVEAAPVDAPPAPADGAPATGDPGEDAYLAGYRLWERGSFADAQLALEAAAKKYPDHRRASFARNLAGRAALDAGKPATAAKLLLANYQEDPRGERAADSLYFLGQSLMALKKPADACKVYAELQDVYGTTLRDFLRQRLPEARAAAKCE